MKIAVAITCHNQHELVRKTISSLYSNSVVPDIVYIMSDAKPYWNLPGDPGFVVPLNNHGKFIGRCGNRNSVISHFIASDCDAIVFMDGDCYPDSYNFIGEYKKLLAEHDLIFGTRKHDDVSTLSAPPADLLTANMDNMWKGEPIDYTDLRVVAGAVTAWQEAKTFSERLDLMLTGMIGWSCNFGFTKEGLIKLRKFQTKTYGLTEGIFDSEAFGDGWGYEDVAMGIDALYAGLDIWITNSVTVGHRSHDRSDGLFDHVKGRHKIMERYRMLDRYAKSRDFILKAAMRATVFFTGGLITGLVTMAINCFKIMELGY